MVLEQVPSLIQAKADVYTAGLITLWGVFLVVNLLVALLFKSKNTNWGKFWGVWFFTALLSGILLAFLIIAPEQASNILIKIKSLFA